MALELRDLRRHFSVLILVSALAFGCSSAKDKKGSPEGQAVCEKLIPIGKRIGKAVDESPKAKRECAVEMDRLVRTVGQKAFDKFVVCLDTVESEADIVECHPESQIKNGGR